MGSVAGLMPDADPLKFREIDTMVLYIGVCDIIRLIRVNGIERFLIELAQYIREDLTRWEEFEKSRRLASHSPEGVIELMPTSDGKLYSFKYVNGHPENPSRGKLTVTAFGVLADVASGYPILLSEMTIATALRTAATSALAASVLSRPESRSMAMIGLGAQAEFQALAFKAIVGIDDLRVFDIDPAAIAKFKHNLEPTGLKITQAASIEQTICGANIVTTATAAKTHAAIITPEMVHAGVHINAIGGDCPGKTELHPDILRQARVVVEYPPQTRIEGEIQQLDADFAVVELWKVLCGQEQGRQTPEQVTIFDSVGFSIEDFATLRFLHDVSKRSRCCASIDLIPKTENPKNLYALVFDA